MCDYLYLHKDIESREDLEEMRINVFVWQEIASEELLLQYASKYPKTTQKRIQTFLSYIHTYDV